MIATRDRAERLTAMLDSLRAQSLGRDRFELIVVDDLSRDRTPGVLRAADDVAGKVTTLRGQGRGPAAARNLGWRTASAPLVAFTDDDCEADPHWLEELVAAASRHPGAVLQGPTNPIPRELWREGPFTRTKRIKDSGPWYQTCNIAYPRALIERLGGFDEGFPEPLGEDTDLGWRSRSTGAPLVFVPSARVHHAVDDIGPLGVVREAARGSDAVLVFKRYPELRRTATTLGVFRSRSMLWAATALLGLILSNRSPAALALTAPYALDVARRVRGMRGSAAVAAFVVVCDLARASASIRGSVRHRTLIL